MHPTHIAAVVHHQQICLHRLTRITAGEWCLSTPTTADVRDLISISKRIKQMIKDNRQLCLRQFSATAVLCQMYRNAVQPAMNHLCTTITLFPQLLDLSQIIILYLIARKEFIQLIDIDHRRSYSLTTHSMIHFIARKSDRNQNL